MWLNIMKLFLRLRRKIRQNYFCYLYCILWFLTLLLLAHHSRKYIISKYVLIWNNFDYYELEMACDDFYQTKNCAYNNCYFTKNHSYFGEDFYKFDAVLFNGHKLKSVPKKRYSNQKYVFVSRKPSLYKPLCSKFFANFFNWTWTFKPDSDIPVTQVLITGAHDNSDHINLRGNLDAVKTKSKEIAWIDKKCDKSDEIKVEFIEQLQHSLTNYGIEIEYYKLCGKNYELCNENDKRFETDILREFHFAVAFDKTTEGGCNYMTEDVMDALENYVVPIILDENYDCLPPNSYLNIVEEGPEMIAYKIDLSLRNKEIFEEYFKWRNVYDYKRSESDICLLCEKLNDNAQMETLKAFDKFGLWWNKREDC